MHFVKLIVKALMEGLVMMEGLVTLYKMQNDMTCIKHRTGQDAVPPQEEELCLCAEGAVDPDAAVLLPLDLQTCSTVSV